MGQLTLHFAGTIVAYVDGGARGNPGPAGYGVRIEQADGTLLSELSEMIGIATNNVAEYQGLIAALNYAVQHGCGHVRIRSDSELLVRQMRGEYRVRNAALKSLHGKALTLASRLHSVSYEHVPRSENAEADRLANRAMDAAKGL